MQYLGVIPFNISEDISTGSYEAIEKLSVADILFAFGDVTAWHLRQISVYHSRVNSAEDDNAFFYECGAHCALRLLPGLRCDAMLFLVKGSHSEHILAPIFQVFRSYVTVEHPLRYDVCLDETDVA